MPAPSKDLLKQNIKTQLLAKGFYRQEFNAETNEVTEHQDQLQDQLDEIVDAIAEGVHLTWTAWQSTQTVTGSTASGTPITGILP